MPPPFALKAFSAGSNALRTFCVPVAPRCLNIAFQCHVQTRLSSTAFGPQPQPPWQLHNLTKIERELYEQYGPNYADEAAAKALRTLIAQKIAQRETTATRMQEKYGEDWYEIISEARERFMKMKAAGEKMPGGRERARMKMEFEHEAAEARGVKINTSV